MPIFQPIVESTPTTVGPTRPIVNNSSAGFANLAGGLLNFGAAVAGQFQEKEADAPTKFEAELAGLKVLRSDLESISQLRISEGKRDTPTQRRAFREAMRRFTVSTGIAASEQGVQDLVNSYGFEVSFAKDPQIVVIQAIKDSDEYEPNFLSAIVDGATVEEAEEIALGNTARGVQIDQAIANDERASTIEANRVIEQFLTGTNALIGIAMSVKKSGLVATEQQFNQIESYFNSMVQKSQAFLARSSNPEDRARVKSALENARLQIDTFKRSQSEPEMRRNLTAEYMNKFKKALDQGLITANQYDLLQSVYLKFDPDAFFTFTRQTGVITDFTEAMKAIRQITEEGSPLLDTTPNVLPPIAKSRKAMEEIDSADAASRRAEAMTWLLNGDPKSVSDPKRLNMAAQSIATLANFLGKSAEDSKWVTHQMSNSFYNDKVVEYFREIGKVDPGLALQLSQEFNSNFSKYSDIVLGQMSSLEQFGIEVDDSNKLKVNFDTLFSNAGVDEESASIFKREMNSFYSSEDEFFSRGFGRAMRSKFESKLSTPPEKRELHNKISAVFRQLDKVESLQRMGEWQDMVNSHQFLTKQMKKFNEIAPSTYTPATPQEVSSVSPLLPLIDKNEGAGDYDTLWRHAQKPGGAFSSKKVSQMTVDDAIAFSDPSGPYFKYVKGTNFVDGKPTGSSPMGRYQIIGTTLDRLKTEMGLSGNEIFSPELQDRMFVELVNGRLAKSNTLEGKMFQLRKEWPGLKNVSDPTLKEIIESIS